MTPECSNPEIIPAEHRSGLTTQTRSLQRLLDSDGTSKDAGFHPEAFCLWPVTVMTASLQPQSGRIAYAGSDLPHPFQFHFSKEGSIIFVQNRPGSDLDGLVRVRPNASGLVAIKLMCRNHRARFLAERNRSATSFPLSDSVPFVRRCPG